MCPAHSYFAFWTYSPMSVTLALCLMMVFWILSFSLVFSIFFSIACWLASSSLLMLLLETLFGICMSVLARHKDWRLFSLHLMGGRVGCLSGKNSLYFPKMLHPAFSSNQNFVFCSVFHCYCLSQIFTVIHLLYSCPIYLHVVCWVSTCQEFIYLFFCSMYLVTELSAFFIHGLWLMFHVFDIFCLIDASHYQHHLYLFIYLSVCVCVCVCVCTCACVCACACVWTGVDKEANSMHTHTHTLTQKHTHTLYIYISGFIHTYIHSYTGLFFLCLFKVKVYHSSTNISSLIEVQYVWSYTNFKHNTFCFGSDDSFHSFIF